jgi:predicted Zn-dependent protease
MKVLIKTGIIIYLLLTLPAAYGAQVPSFLPTYYSPLFDELIFVKKARNNNVEQFVYTTIDQSLALSVEYIEGDRPNTEAMINNIAFYLNDELKSKEGEFKVVTQKEIYAYVKEEQFDKFIIGLVVPGAVQIWTYTTTKDNVIKIDRTIKLIKSISNRQRYNSALSTGNVSMGFWGPEIYEYTKELFKSGNKEEGMEVLRNLLSTSSFNYNAHVDNFQNSDEKEEAKNSASIVLKNAEDRNLINKAAKYLGIEIKSLETIPVLDRNETGLQLILIPLPPCNPWLLEESAKTYEKITGVPVKIRRMKEDWKWKKPDRIFGQRTAQRILIRSRKENIDFSGWNKERYITELMKVSESEEPLSKYHLKEFVIKIEKEPGQYLIDPYLSAFSRLLKRYRSIDDRTMYIGITEANIYSGDNNYVFSTGYTGGSSKASVLSYHMMLAKTLSEEYQSRQRLTERIAKEMVPASLKQLGIPRSTDPTCPYSYSSGVERLDQKTTILSEPVKKALRKIKSNKALK